ncbi:MAG: hypothetical protein ACRDPE_19685 [Solirubrobacterales bacterium]
MAREYKPEQERSGMTARYTEREQEVVSLDDGERRFAKSVTLYGEAIGLGPLELLDFAAERVNRRNAMVDRLLRWVPRKYEDRIKALAEPHDEAIAALRAVGILVANARLAGNALDKPNEEGKT